jgi:hypothetical protein
MLTVKKLITKLKRFDPDLEVCFNDSQFGTTEIDTFDFTDNFQLCFDNEALKDNYSKKILLSDDCIDVLRELIRLSSRDMDNYMDTILLLSTYAETKELMQQGLVTYDLNDLPYPTQAGFNLIYNMKKCRTCGSPIKDKDTFCDDKCKYNYTRGD